VPPEAMRELTNANLSLEGLCNNGLFVWFDDFSKKTDKIKAELVQEFKNRGLAAFWKVQTYKEYEFSKDLLQQFQSDRLLLTLIAVIIIIVACSNIISLLMLLVNDKKKEIAILQSMGASKASIALIFGFCGFITGLLSTLIGTLAAIFTLRHLNLLVDFLSLIQGHTAFNAAFFGTSLPNALSLDALVFVAIVTPIIALSAGLIPALKACQLHPSSILRGE
ncbi:MAG: FtsX-like permease family protein, partial [Parachlamydiales bacterium]|jgi:lipoprotein-releasing system permease protein